MERSAVLQMFIMAHLGSDVDPLFNASSVVPYNFGTSDGRKRIDWVPIIKAHSLH